MRLRLSLSRLGTAAQPALAAAILVGAALLLATIGGRSGPDTAAAEPSLPAETAPAETVAPTAEPTSQPSPTPTPDPTAEPTVEPTSDPTPRPTAKPTPKPTPEPVVGTEPEPTPRLYTARGSFGDTVSIKGVAVWLDPTTPDPGSPFCNSDDPEAQDPRHLVSYHLRMTWSDASDADFPYFKVGRKSWTATNYENGPSRYASGVTYLVTTCNQDADSDEVHIEISMPGDYRWTFN